LLAKNGEEDWAACRTAAVSGAGAVRLAVEWLSKAIEAVAASNRAYIAGAVVVYLVSTFVYALRTFLILRRRGVNASFRVVYVAYLFNIFMNNITPSAKAGGELVRAAYISKQCRVNIASVINVIAFERATEALGIVILILVSLMYGIFDAARSEYLLLAAVAVLAGILVVYHSWDKVLHAVLTRLERRGYLRGAAADVIRFREFFDDYPLLALSVGFGVLVWFLDALRLYLIGRAVGVGIGLVGFIGVSVLYAGIGLLAVTPGGLGIVEGGLTAVLVALGVAPDDALAITLIERLVSYGFGTFLGVLGLLAAGGKRAWKALKSQ